MTKATDLLNVQRTCVYVGWKLERIPVEAKVKEGRRGRRKGEETADWGHKAADRLCLSICNKNVGVMKWAVAFPV